MKSTPYAAGSSSFATTHWSLIVSVGGCDAVQSAAAMQQLCKSYWQPLYSYVRRRGYAPEDAQDLTQEFFARLLDNRCLARADQTKGKFRSFLLGSVKNFLADEWDKTQAQKRGGGIFHCSLNFKDGEHTYEMEPANNVTPEQIFERRWALTLLNNVLHRLTDEYDQTGRGELFQALNPCLIGERTAQPYAQLAESQGTTESAIKSAVHRLRGRYRELLRQEIANTVARPEEVDEELNYLFIVLGRR